MLIDIYTTLTAIAKIAVPYNPGSHAREVFLATIEAFPYLEDEFNSQLSEPWIKAVNEVGEVYFITNFEHCIYVTPHIRLGFCGVNRLPFISVYC